MGYVLARSFVILSLFVCLVYVSATVSKPHKKAMTEENRHVEDSFWGK